MSDTSAEMAEIRTQMLMTKTLKDHVADLVADGVRCNCDLDNWEPERDSGHSWVCRIHKAAKGRKRHET